MFRSDLQFCYSYNRSTLDLSVVRSRVSIRRTVFLGFNSLDWDSRSYITQSRGERSSAKGSTPRCEVTHHEREDLQVNIPDLSSHDHKQVNKCMTSLTTRLTIRRIRCTVL